MKLGATPGPFLSSAGGWGNLGSMEANTGVLGDDLEGWGQSQGMGAVVGGWGQLWGAVKGKGGRGHLWGHLPGAGPCSSAG